MNAEEGVYQCAHSVGAQRWQRRHRKLVAYGRIGGRYIAFNLDET